MLDLAFSPQSDQDIEDILHYLAPRNRSAAERLLNAYLDRAFSVLHPSRDQTSVLRDSGDI